MELIFNECDLPEKAVTDRMKEAAALCLEREGIDAENVEISVSFVSKEEIKELNDVYRKNNSVTDVLSFPQYGDLSELRALCGGETDKDDDQAGYESDEPYAFSEISLGDVVICTERAEEQAEEFGHSLQREIVYLFVHSMFHLLGYDHMEQDEKDRMRLAEEEIMTKIDVIR